MDRAFLTTKLTKSTKTEITFQRRHALPLGPFDP